MATVLDACGELIGPVLQETRDFTGGLLGGLLDGLTFFRPLRSAHPLLLHALLLHQLLLQHHLLLREMSHPKENRTGTI